MKRFIAIAVILSLTLAFAACGGGENRFKIYYKNAEGDALMSEEHKADIPRSSDKAQIVEYLIGELSKSPKTEGLINVLPDGTQLLSVKMQGRTAVVDLSKEYYQNRDVDELLARMAIVNTLCDISGISSVEILIEGDTLISTTTGAEIGRISRNDVVYGLQDGTVSQKETVVIYFPDKDASKLVPEERVVEVQATLSIERLVLSELMKGPSSSELVQVLPSDVKVISTETKDGVCFVNLSGDIIDKIPAGPSSTTMALFSIVNSLAELETIDSVQILIDGKTGVQFGNFVLDAPFEKNKTLIKD